MFVSPQIYRLRPQALVPQAGCGCIWVFEEMVVVPDSV